MIEYYKYFSKISTKILTENFFETCIVTSFCCRRKTKILKMLSKNLSNLLNRFISKNIFFRKYICIHIQPIAYRFLLSQILKKLNNSIDYPMVYILITSCKFSIFINLESNYGKHEVNISLNAFHKRKGCTICRIRKKGKEIYIYLILRNYKFIEWYFIKI